MKVPMHREDTRGYFRVYLPTVDLPPGKVQFLTMAVTQKVREHDVAVFRIKSIRTNWFKYFSSGTPIRIRFRSFSNKDYKGEFVGYISHVRLATQGDNREYVRDVICVGASYVFREAVQKTYKRQTPAEVVYEVARSFDFEPIVKQDGLRRDTITQSGQTYWQFMHKLADKVGYVLKAEGTSLVFMPLGEYANGFLDSAPMFSDYGQTVGGRFVEPNVIDIHSLSGDTSLDKDRLSDQAVFAWVDPVTGESDFEFARPTLGAKASRSKFNRFLSAKSVSHTAYEAKLLAKGASDNGLMALDASMRVQGNPMLSPYRPVQLNLRDPNLSGIWLVKEVTHRIGRGKDPSYTCDVTVSTDSVDGIPRRRLRSGSQVSLQRKLLASSSRPQLLTANTGFVVGTSASSSSTWSSR